MKKTLILGTNSNIGNKEIIDASRSMGVSTVLTDHYDPKDNPLKQYADECWDISTADVDALEERCRAEGVTGVYGGTDFAQDVALELCERLGLPSYCDKESWRYSRDKVAFKAMCRKHGVPVAEDAVISAAEGAAGSPIGYPVVVKPADRSGNAGVSYCYSDADYAPAVEEALTKSEGGQVIVERMLTGKFYASDYVMRGGEMKLLALNSCLSQPGAPTNRYTVMSTVVEPGVLNRFLEDVNPRIIEMLKDMGCHDGVANVQLLADDQGSLFAIEMGHRLEASMHWLPKADVTGFDEAKWMAHYVAFGNNDALAMPTAQSKPFKSCACSYLLWTNKAGVVVEAGGLDQVQVELQSVIRVVPRKGESVDAGQYGVIVLFSAADSDEMCRKIRFVNEHISLIDKAGEDLLTRFDDFETLHAMYSGH